MGGIFIFQYLPLIIYLLTAYRNTDSYNFKNSITWNKWSLKEFGYSRECGPILYLGPVLGRWPIRGPNINLDSCPVLWVLLVGFVLYFGWFVKRSILAKSSFKFFWALDQSRTKILDNIITFFTISIVNHGRFLVNHKISKLFEVVWKIHRPFCTNF